MTTARDAIRLLIPPLGMILLGVLGLTGAIDPTLQIFLLMLLMIVVAFQAGRKSVEICRGNQPSPGAGG